MENNDNGKNKEEIVPQVNENKETRQPVVVPLGINQIKENLSAFRAILNEEFSTMETMNREVFIRKPVDIMICIQFEDGHTHSVLPHIDVVEHMIQAIIGEVRKQDNKVFPTSVSKINSSAIDVDQEEKIKSETTQAEDTKDKE